MESDTFSLGSGGSSVRVRRSAVAVNLRYPAPGGGAGAEPAHTGPQVAAVAPRGPSSCLQGGSPSSVCLCCRAQLLRTLACFPL